MVIRRDFLKGLLGAAASAAVISPEAAKAFVGEIPAEERRSVVFRYTLKSVHPEEYRLFSRGWSHAERTRICKECAVTHQKLDAVIDVMRNLSDRARVASSFMEEGVGTIDEVLSAWEARKGGKIQWVIASMDVIDGR